MLSLKKQGLRITFFKIKFFKAYVSAASALSSVFSKSTSIMAKRRFTCYLIISFKYLNIFRDHSFKSKQ